MKQSKTFDSQFVLLTWMARTIRIEQCDNSVFDCWFNIIEHKCTPML